MGALVVTFYDTKEKNILEVTGNDNRPYVEQWVWILNQHLNSRATAVIREDPSLVPVRFLPRALDTFEQLDAILAQIEFDSKH
jgi:hypothetical protein